MPIAFAVDQVLNRGADLDAVIAALKNTAGAAGGVHHNPVLAGMRQVARKP